MVWSTIARLIVVPVAFLLAMGASGAVLLTLGLERVTAALSEREGMEGLGTIFGVLRHGWLLASGITLLPACLAVLAGELGHVRSALYYMTAGGASLAAIPLLAQLGPDAATKGAAILSWQVFATAGFVGGLVYWLIAGRRA
jgi:hypothetical protein